MKIYNQQQGFTLVEALVSLVILTVALIPILSLATNALRVSSEIQDNLVASGLAQEGVEVIRAIRDTNWFSGNSFDTNLGSGVIGDSTTYQVEWDSIPPLQTNASPLLNILNGRYSHSTGGGWAPTKFSRTVTITKINAGELRVVSQVTWQGRYNSSKSIVAEDHLFNWK
jgi:prepilin-type N-terminal cleavage/methylation domain-containing protein